MYEMLWSRNSQVEFQPAGRDLTSERERDGRDKLTTTDPLTQSFSPIRSPTHRPPSASCISLTRPPSFIVTTPFPTSSIRRRSARWRFVFSVMRAIGWSSGGKWIAGVESRVGLAHT